jgi:hypothetical protein
MDRLNTFFAGDMTKMEAFLHLYSGRFPLKSKCPPGIMAIEAVKALLLVDGLEDAARDNVKKHTEEWAASKGPAGATLTSTSTQGLDGADLTLNMGTSGNTQTPEIVAEDDNKSGNARPAFCKSLWKNMACSTQDCQFFHTRCELTTCKPTRNPNCPDFHGRTTRPRTTLPVSKNRQGGRGPPQTQSGPSSWKKNKSNGLGLRALQDQLANANLRLEVQRLKSRLAPSKTVRPIMSYATATAASSQPTSQLSQPTEPVCGNDLVRLLTTLAGITNVLQPLVTQLAQLGGTLKC